MAKSVASRRVARLFSIALLASLILSVAGIREPFDVRAQEATPQTPTPAGVQENETTGAEASSQPAQLTAAATPSAGASGPEVVWATGPSLSQPLSSIVQTAPAQGGGERELNPLDRQPLPKVQAAAAATSLMDESIVQSAAGPNLMPSTTANFNGVVNLDGYYPPDTNGDVGFDAASNKKYYMMWVNVRYQIWDVTNPASPMSVLGPALGNTLFSGVGDICEFNNDGDPIVLFDHLANRWFASQFAFTNGNNRQCIAVSTSANPTGTWNRYSFLWSNTKFNDYPKFGVWPDGYYMSANQYIGNNWAGAGVAVFNRAAMLTGAAANMIKFDLGAVNLFYGAILPSDLDGPAPETGTPNYFVEWDDSTWATPDDPSDMLRLWNFHVDWATPSNSTFGADSSFTPNQMIATSNVDPNMCNYSRNCIPQPGSPPPPKLDAISDRLMHRMQYRNFGAYQTLVTNHTVDVGTNQAGIHWFELRDSGGGWGMHQQGVYSPDSNNRWMGSLAMDGSGDMALGYSVSSASTYPSVRYTGRLAGDTLGTMPQGEGSIIAGTGVQTGSAGRWGDYSMMSVDPTDDCTFWYTNEYYATTGSVWWSTRVGSFVFPSCSPLAAGPAILKLYPTPDSTVCRMPQVGVKLALTDAVRDGSGSFDPSTVTLLLDNIDRTAAANISQAATYPVSEATVLYTPPSNLNATTHEVKFMYPTPLGTQTRTWSFTAASITCPTIASLEAPVKSGVLSSSAGTGTSASEAVTPSAEASMPMQDAYRRLILQR